MRRFLKLSVILLTALIAAGCSKSDVPEEPEQPEGSTTSEEVDAIAYAQTDVNDTKEVIELMVNAWNSDDTDYTLESIYNRAPR